MNPFKIIGWVAIAIAIVSAFAPFEYSGLLLVLLGLAGGVAVAAEDHVRVLVTALVLATLSGVLMKFPDDVGMYLAAIYGNAGVFVAGASLMIITRKVWRRYKP